MAKRYKLGDSAHVRAVQIWPILIAAAHEHRILRYKDIGKLIGLTKPRIGPALYRIQEYCEQNGLPSLTSIVVYDRDWTPGNGLVRTAQLSAMWKKVYLKEWYKIIPPTSSQIKNAWDNR